MEKEVNLECRSFSKRLGSMLAVDLKRMLKSRIFYILIVCALVIPILIVVMTSMMAGTESVDPVTGEVKVMEEMFTNAWQSIGSLPLDETAGSKSVQSTEASMAEMDITSMCNINMMYMAAAVFICLFISEDFRSGYAKNLFTVRAKKVDYVASKTVIGFVCGALMLIAYFIGAMLGGAIAGLSFALGTLTVSNIVFCMISKVFLMLVFIAIFVLVSVAAKQRAWLAVCGSLGAGMLLFMMVSMVTPLASTMMNVILCLAGGAMFAFGLGAIGNIVLKKTSLV